jgi:hypothetical protein
MLMSVMLILEGPEQGLSSLRCSALQALSNLNLLNLGGVEATAAAARYNLYGTTTTLSTYGLLPRHECKHLPIIGLTMMATRIMPRKWH